MSEFWSSFAPQLLATVVGALIGVVSVVAVFRLERRASADDAFDRAVERLLMRIDELADAADVWQKTSDMSSWRLSDRPPAHPYPGRVSIAMELMRLKTHSIDQLVMAEISSTWGVIAQSYGSAQSTACGLLAGAIVKWQAGDELASIQATLGVARQVATDGLSNIEDHGSA